MHGTWNLFLFFFFRQTECNDVVYVCSFDFCVLLLLHSFDIECDSVNIAHSSWCQGHCSQSWLLCMWSVTVLDVDQWYVDHAESILCQGHCSQSWLLCIWSVTVFSVTVGCRPVSCKSCRVQFVSRPLLRKLCMWSVTVSDVDQWC